ncbi:IS607 family transposase [archaeon]|nr:IS607 family transposase [archaeon]MBT6779257.1 IS607 family transposase [bacterium]
MSYVTQKKAEKYYNVTSKTLHRWDEKGKIKTKRTEGGHRRYFIKEEKDDGKISIIYTRVSSKKQKSDLQRQTKFLKNKYESYKVISDIGSGINFSRKGFNSILDELFKRNIKEVVVTRKDRFVRFGYSFFKDLFNRFGAKLTVITDKKNKTSEEELSEDLLSIITVFTARYYGKRRYNINKKNTDISI